MIHLHGTQAVAFRVLVVDKDPIQRLVLARCVEMLGWQADTVENSGEAVDRFAARRHNVVVIDLVWASRPQCGYCAICDAVMSIRR
jgi:CheY-like chemotaxis protein